MTPPLVMVHGSEPVTACVIWLHGLGADGEDFAPVVQALALSAVRFVLPHAPSRPVSINGGYVMPAWYDIRSRDLSQAEDAEGLNQSRTRVAGLITEQVAAGIAPQRIVLAGFSQGGATVLYSALTLDMALAGVMVLSAYMPLQASLDLAAAHHVPVFMAHGAFDEVIPIGLAEMARDRLEQAGWPVSWHSYPMAHSVCEAEIAAIRSWLVRLLRLA
ncbi:alpha/beta hydrolase [Sulfuriferula sp.]|uniref:alpha/beta hydrolase n=1 Tax=Sulfuriferula sp. TaxID=2025307 RepID=UPI0027320FB8|nr:dienelactone hydrolase family protein [Sulfuriferula sp.]MDP2027640.1 dienelactone hydrolase family protein [Sulfuriferula sp.]